MRMILLAAMCCLVPASLLANCPTADLTDDCFVDLADLILLANQWMVVTVECPPPDLTGDCHVNSVDFAVTSAQWLTGDRIPDDMVFIPGGTFQMGNSTNAEEGESDELPVHTVTLDSFVLGKYEITHGQYCDFLNSAYPTQLKVVDRIIYALNDVNKRYQYCGAISYGQLTFSNNIFGVRTKGGRDMSRDPLVWVSWYGAVAYCNWRSQQEGRELCYDLSTWTCDFTKKGYRLPTEAEWEYAARGGLSGKRFPWDDTITHLQANYFSSDSLDYDISSTRGYHPDWYDGFNNYTSPVGSFLPNAYGLYDMAGNVWEWCHDWYSDTYYNSSPQTNPTGVAPSSFRVLRGGCWHYQAIYCRVSDRTYHVPYYWFNNDGFRIVLKLD